MRRWLLFAALIVSSLTVPAVSHAQIMNGDFEIGGADWTPGVPAGWSVAFPDSGGNPDGFAQITLPEIDLSSKLGLAPGTALITIHADEVVRDGGNSVISARF